MTRVQPPISHSILNSVWTESCATGFRDGLLGDLRGLRWVSEISPSKLGFGPLRCTKRMVWPLLYLRGILSHPVSRRDEKPKAHGPRKKSLSFPLSPPPSLRPLSLFLSPPLPVPHLCAIGLRSTLIDQNVLRLGTRASISDFVYH